MSERMPKFNPDYKHSSEGTPEEIKEAEKHLTKEHHFADAERRDEWRETMKFATATEAVEASKLTGHWRACLDTPENREYLEQFAHSVMESHPESDDKSVDYIHDEAIDDKSGEVIDEGWAVHLVKE